jgi:hypothetical protein
MKNLKTAIPAIRFWLLATLFLLLSQPAWAGEKLTKLKEDVKRIQRGTLLVAPVLPDSFVLQKLSKPGQEALRKTYLDRIASSNLNLRDKLQQHYHFSKVEFLTDTDYASYFAHLRSYDSEKYFVLQFGHAVQFAEGKAHKIKKYDRDLLGIFATDGKSRLYLNAGKVDLFYKREYAAAIVQNLQLNLDKYARDKKVKSSAPKLLVPQLHESVALIPQEKLFGSDSATFMNHQWQTVVNVKPVTFYRVFGGKALPGGLFVGIEPAKDTSAVRADLAILPSWGNTLHFEAVIDVPPATKLQIGIAGPQPPLPGGAAQVILPFQWDTRWIREVHDLKSSKKWTFPEFLKEYPQYAQ